MNDEHQALVTRVERALAAFPAGPLLKSELAAAVDRLRHTCELLEQAQERLAAVLDSEAVTTKLLFGAPQLGIYEGAPIDGN